VITSHEAERPTILNEIVGLSARFDDPALISRAYIFRFFDGIVFFCYVQAVYPFSAFPGVENTRLEKASVHADAKGRRASHAA
jgi:hypothetical protein